MLNNFWEQTIRQSMNLHYFSQDLEVQQVGEQVGHQVHEQAGKNIDPDAMTKLPPSTPTSQSRRLSIKESTTEAKATGYFLLFICPHKNVLSELKVNTVVIVNSMSFPSRFRQGIQFHPTTNCRWEVDFKPISFPSSSSSSEVPKNMLHLPKRLLKWEAVVDSQASHPPKPLLHLQSGAGVNKDADWPHARVSPWQCWPHFFWWVACRYF